MASSFTIPVPPLVQAALDELEPGVVPYTSFAALTAVPTADGAVVAPKMFYTYVAGNLKTWLFRAGTEAHSADGGILRPDDFHVSTNAFVFELQS